MTYAQARKILESRQEARVELGLERVSRHLSRLGHPERAWASIHVAGTNGKGSVCAMLDRVLREADLKTGLFTSPHIRDVRERIRVDGRPIPRAAFARLMGRARAAERGEKLSYFELLTSVAFQYFAARGVDVAVLETGLGGRLDATNVVERPLACVITSVDIDHTGYLGRTIRLIAGEKAGIIKSGTPVFCPNLPEEAMAVVRRKARSLGAPLRVVRPWRSLNTDWNHNNQVVGFRGRNYRLSLLGGRQPQNAALAHAAVKTALNRGREGKLERAFRAGLRNVSVPGRFEVRRVGRRTVVVDGAHNQEAIGHLRETLDRWSWSKSPIRVIIGVLRDKDARAMLRAFGRGLQDVVAVTPPGPRALPAADLAGLIRHEAPGARVRAASDVSTALREWLMEPKAPQLAVVCGSFLLVGPALSVLGNDD